MRPPAIRGCRRRTFAGNEFAWPSFNMQLSFIDRDTSSANDGSRPASDSAAFIWRVAYVIVQHGGAHRDCTCGSQSAMSASSPRAILPLRCSIPYMCAWLVAVSDQGLTSKHIAHGGAWAERGCAREARFCCDQQAAYGPGCVKT